MTETNRPPKKTIRGNPQGDSTIVKGAIAPSYGARRAETGPERASRLRVLVRQAKRSGNL